MTRARFEQTGCVALEYRDRGGESGLWACGYVLLSRCDQALSSPDCPLSRMQGKQLRIKSFRVQNFRRLKNVKVDLDEATTIFVGANNSGKTSATHVFQCFLDPKKTKFQIYDFTADCWPVFDNFTTGSGVDVELPAIRLDLWFEVDDDNVHRVERLLPGLGWGGEPVGVRMVYAPRDQDSLIANYLAAQADAIRAEARVTSYKPWPQNLREYLTKQLLHEYEVKYYVLDERECDDDLLPNADYEPYYLGTGASGADRIVNSLIKVDFLHAQRHLSDSDSRGRAEDLSHRLSRYYQRNLEQHETDIAALNAIADSESALNIHFGRVFGSILNTIGQLGVANLGLVIRASLNPQSLMSTSARVHYAVSDAQGGSPGESTAFLPDQYNGLGFKNLIYMAVEVLDFHYAWAETEGGRPPVHLVVIEEPEAHLHAQLQQVFIRKILEILPDPEIGFQTQMVVTTHSSHILYERSLQPIRYFCRLDPAGVSPCSDVRDLSVFYQRHGGKSRKFLQKYMRLMHCDLFFADAAILVEGNVERLLVPMIIEREVSDLRSSHLTILEVGGAHAHIFQELIVFLGVPALVITDLDSVEPSGADQNEEDNDRQGKTCMINTPEAVTANPTLGKWLPKQSAIVDLLDLPDADKVISFVGQDEGTVRVAYQTRHSVTWRSSTAELAGRTLEEAFALENLAWTQDPSGQALGLRIRGSDNLMLDELHCKIFERVRNLDKTTFALNLIADESTSWLPPRYIVDGLTWLHDRLRVSASTAPRFEAVQ